MSQALKDLLPSTMHAAVDHAHGTTDDSYPAEAPPALLGPLQLFARRRASAVWLPEGYHMGLHIEHRPLPSAGPFTGGGNKWLWHITVSPWNTVDAMWTVLRDKNAASQLIVGGRQGLKHPVVIQCMPLNRAGRALAHPSGPETNRADCFQVEICANPADVPFFATKKRYEAFANLVRLVNTTVEKSQRATWKQARSFQDTTRFGGQEFVDAAGHCGHMHVPGNDHGDPTTAFRGDRLIDLLHHMPVNGYKL
jgi:hypothetical protein